MSADLALFNGRGETVADLLTAAAQARTLVGIVKDAQTAVDTALADKVDQTAAALGTAFTARGDGPISGWRAELTAPDWKPKVTDREAFERWWVEAGLPHEMRDRVVVDDHERAAAALAEYVGTPHWSQETLQRIADCLHVDSELLLPDQPLEMLSASRFKATEVGLVDTDTGETVPGVSCTRARPQLRVVGSKDAKASMRREVASAVGVDLAVLEEATR